MAFTSPAAIRGTLIHRDLGKRWRAMRTKQRSIRARKVR